MKFKSTTESIASMKGAIDSVKRGREVTVNRQFFLALLVDYSNLYDSDTDKLSENHYQRLYEDLNKKTRDREVVTTAKLALRNCITQFVDRAVFLDEHSKFEHC